MVVHNFRLSCDGREEWGEIVCDLWSHCTVDNLTFEIVFEACDFLYHVCDFDGLSSLSRSLSPLSQQTPPPLFPTTISTWRLHYGCQRICIIVVLGAAGCNTYPYIWFTWNIFEVCVMISGGPVMATTFYLGIYSLIVKAAPLKICMMITLPMSIPVFWPWLYFKATGMTEMSHWKLCFHTELRSFCI